MTRRSFAAAAGAAALAGKAAGKMKLGIDVFSIRSSGFSPFEFLDYAAKHKVDVVFFSELRFLGSLEDAHLRRVRDHAQKLGLGIEVGNTSICPSSRRFDPSKGAAEQQLAQIVRVAKALGSPVARCFIGSAEDRKGPLPIEAHIENTVKVLRNSRSLCQDLGVKVAVENHAGDMQGRELKMLIEEAGKDFVGACIDPGNSTWALEDPHVTLEALAPYVLTSGIRDSALWRTPEGIAVQWVRMGEGNVDIAGWARRFMERCPHSVFQLETICLPPRVYKIFDHDFWKGYENVRAAEFTRFLRLAEAGKPFTGWSPPPKELAAKREQEDLEACIAYCRNTLGL